MQVCNEGVLESFRSASGSLDDLQGRVSVYLDRKRDAFPRFYFLSNAALLQVRGNECCGAVHCVAGAAHARRVSRQNSRATRPWLCVSPKSPV